MNSGDAKLKICKAIVFCMMVGYSVSAGSAGHVPGIGVDTAGVYLFRNKEFKAMGWEVPAFSSALDELGVEFLVDHYLHIHGSGSHEQNFKNTAADIQALAVWLKATGREYIWNVEDPNFVETLEYVPGENLYEPEPGQHYFKAPEELLRELQKSPNILGLCYDEMEHMLLSNSRFMKKGAIGDVPAWADTAELKLPEAYALAIEKLIEVKAYNDRFGQMSMVETIWPVMHHLFARTGWTLAPKLMKEGWTPVPLAMALGAAVEYEKTGCDFWVTPDLWSNVGYPGHSTEELRSALLAAHWVGASRVYVENLDWDNPEKDKHHRDAHGMQGSLVFFEGADKYRVTPYGEVFKWYAKDYRKQHPIPYTWRDARCKVAIVRFPDSCWGARGTFFRDRLLGSKIESSTPETEAWFSIWHQLTLGTIPKTGLSFHSRGAAGKLGPRFFCPAPPTLVFDHRVGNEHPEFDFRGAELLFLTGTEMTRETLITVNRYLQKTGAKAVLLKSLVPDGFKPNSRWLIVDSFDDPAVQKWLKPFLSPEDEMQFLFGDYEVVFKKVDRDRIRVFLDGKPVSPVVVSESRTSLGEGGKEILRCEDCQERKQND